MSPIPSGGGGKNQHLPNSLSLSSCSNPQPGSSLTLTTATEQSSASDGDGASSYAVSRGKKYQMNYRPSTPLEWLYFDASSYVVSREKKHRVINSLFAFRSWLNRVKDVGARNLHDYVIQLDYKLNTQTLIRRVNQVIRALEKNSDEFIIDIDDLRPLACRFSMLIDDLDEIAPGHLGYFREVMQSYPKEVDWEFIDGLMGKENMDEPEKSAVYQGQWEIRDKEERISYDSSTSIIHENGSPHLASRYVPNPKEEFPNNLGFKRDTGCLPSSRLVQIPCADGRNQHIPGRVSYPLLHSSPTTRKLNRVERPELQIPCASGGGGNSDDGGSGGQRPGSSSYDNSDSSSHKPLLLVALLTFFTAVSSMSLALLPFFTYCFKYLLPRTSVSHMFTSGFGNSVNEVIGLVAVVYCASLVANVTFAVLCAWLLETGIMDARISKLTYQKLNGTDDSSAKGLFTQNEIDVLTNRKLSPPNETEVSSAEGLPTQNGPGVLPDEKLSPPNGDLPAKGLPPRESNSSERWREVLKRMSSMKLALEKVVEVIKAVVTFLESLLSVFN